MNRIPKAGEHWLGVECPACVKFLPLLRAEEGRVPATSGLGPARLRVDCFYCQAAVENILGDLEIRQV